MARGAFAWGGLVLADLRRFGHFLWLLWMDICEHLRPSRCSELSLSSFVFVLPEMRPVSLHFVAFPTTRTACVGGSQVLVREPHGKLRRLRQSSCCRTSSSVLLLAPPCRASRIQRLTQRVLCYSRSVPGGSFSPC